MPKNKQLSLGAVIFCYCFLIAVCFFIKPWNNNGPLTGDVSGYYMYLPGIFYDNLGQLNNHQYIIDHYHPCGVYLNEHIGPIGKYVIKYSGGMAIMYLPGFVAGHIYAKMGAYPVDGFSYPYQFCLSIYSLLVMFVGLWLIRKILLQYFSDKVVSITVIALVLATNYLNYAAIANMFTHGYLFTVYAAIINLTIQWHKRYDYKRSIGIGLLCGLAALSRPTEIISILIPLLWGISNWAVAKERFNVFMLQKQKLAILILAAALIGSVQLVYWKIYAGQFLYWSYKGSGDELNLLKLYVGPVLFSYQKGWFAYTPFMVLSFIGFVTLYKKAKELFWVSVIFSFAAFYLVCSWKNWSYGGSFSMRALIQYYAILVFPVASFIEFSLRGIFSSVIFFMFLLFCIWLNLVMTYQANGGDNMDCSHETKTYYWKVFGQLKSDNELKKFLDTDEEIPARDVIKLKPLLQTSFCVDTLAKNCKFFEEKWAYLLDAGVVTTPVLKVNIQGKKGNWFRVYNDVFIKSVESLEQSPVLYVTLSDANNKEVKKKFYNIQRISKNGQWETFFIDIFVAEESSATYLTTGINHPGKAIELYVANTRIEFCK